jgi:hypothetical protein
MCLATQDRRLQVFTTTVEVALNPSLFGVFNYGKALALTLSSHVADTSAIASLAGDLAMPICLSIFTLQGILLSFIASLSVFVPLLSVHHIVSPPGAPLNYEKLLRTQWPITG